jgi:hypothetical protein
MANPTTSSTLKDLSHQITDNIPENVPESLKQTAKDTYNDASFWIRQNYGMVLGVLGGITVVGLLGYFLSRRDGQSESEREDDLRKFEQSRGFERV